jgi:hypothetical protein
MKITPFPMLEDLPNSVNIVRVMYEIKSFEKFLFVDNSRE